MLAHGLCCLLLCNSIGAIGAIKVLIAPILRGFMQRVHTSKTLIASPVIVQRADNGIASPMVHESHYRSSDEDRAEEEDAAPSGLGERIPTSPLFRPSNLRCVNTLSGHHSGIRAIAIQQRTNRVFTGSYDNTIKVWNLDGGSCEATLEGHVAWIRSLFCHGHEPLLFSGSDDGEIKVWRTDSHDLTGGIQTQAGGILAITVDYEREWLLAGCYDTSIQVFALPACELLHILPGRGDSVGHRSAVRCLTIYNGCLISGSYDRTVKLWDLADECKCIGGLAPPRDTARH